MNHPLSILNAGIFDKIIMLLRCYDRLAFDAAGKKRNLFGGTPAAMSRKFPDTVS
jgi:hypothetical protein